MNPRIIEERIDHAEVLRSTAELIEGTRDLKYRAQLIGYITKQIADTEKIHAESQGRLMERILGTYQASSQRRYDSRAFLRVLSLGFSSRRDADKAAEGALGEVEQLIRATEAMNKRRIMNAVLARLPLLRFLAGSRQGGNELAARMLRAFLPQQYGRVLPVQGRQVEERPR